MFMICVVSDEGVKMEGYDMGGPLFYQKGNSAAYLSAGESGPTELLI